MPSCGDSVPTGPATFPLSPRLRLLPALLRWVRFSLGWYLQPCCPPPPPCLPCSTPRPHQVLTVLVAASAAAKARRTPGWRPCEQLDAHPSEAALEAAPRCAWGAVFENEGDGEAVARAWVRRVLLPLLRGLVPPAQQQEQGKEKEQEQGKKQGKEKEQEQVRGGLGLRREE